MIYLFPTLYKDKWSDVTFLFVNKGKDKRQNRDVWQPVTKVFPFVYVNRKIGSAFVDYKENFKKVNT